MAILLTNDDGIDADGINALKEALEDIMSVYVVAPMKQRSACSHSISFFKALKLSQRSKYDFALDSTPADCVRAAILGLVEENIDIVISGMNHGANIGYDIHYSGTAAGAREAVLSGKRGVAFSLTDYEARKEDFIRASKYAAKIVESILKNNDNSHNSGVFLNINIPNVNKIKGISVTGISKRQYKDRIEIVDDEKEGKLLTITGEIPDATMTPGTDAYATCKGQISVSPISVKNESPDVDLSYINGVLL